MINIYNAIGNLNSKYVLLLYDVPFFMFSSTVPTCTKISFTITQVFLMYSFLPYLWGCNIWLLNRMEDMSQSTNYAIKKMHSTVICLLMTNLANIQFTVLITLIIKFNLKIKLNIKMVKLLSKLSFTICDNIHWLLI